MKQLDTNPNFHPPRISAWILAWLLSDHFDTHSGDFEEFYHLLVGERGKRRADWWYRGQVLRLIPDQLFEKVFWGIPMLRSYLLVGMRNLSKNKLPATINVLGLSAAIGCTIALFLFVYGINTADRFHQNVENVFLIGHTTDAIETLPGTKQKWGTSPVPMGPALVAAYPQVEKAVRYSKQGAMVRAKRVAFRERVSFADTGFFDMFTFPLSSGDASTLENPATVIISAEIATKYFGKEDPLGRELVIQFENGNEEMLAVGGVAQPFPVTAAFKFDFLVGYEKRLDAGLGSLDDWDEMTATFLDFHDAEDAPFIASELDLMIRPPESGDQASQILSFFLDSVRHPNWLTAFLIKDRALSAPRIIETAMFGILALLMLLVSCFNYITIALGSSARRLREIGIRKSTGAIKKQLVFQFLTENLLVCFAALAGGVIFAWSATIPFMNGMVHPNLEIQPGYFGNGAFWIFLVGLLAAVGLVSGSYPAFYVSSFQPIEILRGSRRLAEKKGLTRALTTAQFVLTIITISFATFAWSLDEKLTAGDWGYEHETILVLPVVNLEHYTQLKNEAEQLVHVDHVAGTRDHIGANRRRTSVMAEGQEKKSYVYSIGPSYLTTMGLVARRGRLFSDAYTADESTSIVINQTFVNQMGWADPLGQSIRIEDHAYAVVGVVEDFLLSPYDGMREPVIFSLTAADTYSSLAIRVDNGILAPTVASLKDIWETKFPEVAFSSYPQSEVFDSDSMKGLSVFMGYVAIFALFISCMGLFGLASQKVALRMKEIGIRKSMGASALHLMFVVNREFLAMLALATAIATPLCYLTFSNTLLRFTEIDLPPSFAPYIVANLLVFAVACLSLSLQSRKLLKVAPAEVLRND